MLRTCHCLSSNACHTVSLTHWAVYTLYLISLWRRQSPYTDSNALSVSLPVISSNFFHSISPCVCVPSPAHPDCCLAVVSAKHSAHSMLCCDIGEKCNIIIPTGYIKMSFPLVLFSEETSSTAASACYANWPLHCDRPLSLACQFASLSTGRLSRSLFFCLSQLACLCGHPSVYLPVYRHVCEVCTHFCPPRYLSPWQPNAVFLPWFGADPGETLRRLIWGLADVRLIAFQCRSFWQWYWWMGLQKMWRGIS